MTKDSLIIKRTKLKSILYLLLFVPVFSMFLFAGIYILSSEESESNLEIGFAIFIIALMLFAVTRLINPLIKIFSNNPEFEIKYDRLILYDNLKYNYILFKDLIGCKTFRMKYFYVIALYIKKESTLQGNFAKFKMKAWGIPKYVEKAVILDLDFAEIKHEKFEKLINTLIERNKE